MAKLERVRESLEGSLDPEYLKQREKAGWRLVGVEWEREAEWRPQANGAAPRRASLWRSRGRGLRSPRRKS